MPIAIHCPQCGSDYQVDEDLGGKAVRCRQCHERIKVPETPQKMEMAAKDEPEVEVLKKKISIRKVNEETSYRCPFCQSAQRPMWQNYWTPISTLILIFVLMPTFFFIFYCVGAVFAAASLAGSDQSQSTSFNIFSLALFGTFVLTIFVFFSLLSASSWVREARQVCPECGLRLS